MQKLYKGRINRAGFRWSNRGDLRLKHKGLYVEDYEKENKTDNICKLNRESKVSLYKIKNRGVLMFIDHEYIEKILEELKMQQGKIFLMY